MRALVFALIAICSGTSVCRMARAADTPALAKAIYGNISASSTIKQEALLLLNPSLPVEWPAQNSGTLEGRIQSLADSLPEPQWIFSPKKDTFRDILSLVAQHGHFAKVSDTGAMREGLTESEAQLLFQRGDRTRPTEEYTQFLDFSRRISDAAASIKKQTDAHKRAELDLERSEASLRLSALPHLDEIRRATRKLDSAPGHQTMLDKDHILKMLSSYRGAQFTPRIDKWSDASGWVRIEAPINESYDAPIFAVGPSEFSDDWWSPKALNGLFGKKVSRLSFEIKRVLVDRPGMDLSIFDLRSWKFDDDTLLSDGQLLVHGSAMKGRMPLLVVGLLLCRNIVVSTPYSADAHNGAISASGQDAFRFGTLLLGGAYLLPPSKDRFYPALGARGITSPEIQVIALISNQIGLSPNPDSSLKW